MAEPSLTCRQSRTRAIKSENGKGEEGRTREDPRSSPRQDRDRSAKAKGALRGQASKKDKRVHENSVFVWTKTTAGE